MLMRTFNKVFKRAVNHMKTYKGKRKLQVLLSMKWYPMCWMTRNNAIMMNWIINIRIRGFQSMIFNLARTMQSLQALSCKRYITMKIYKLKIINYSHVLKSAQKWLIQFPKTRSKQSPSMMLKVTLPS
jgi:hypothetical protein